MGYAAKHKEKLLAQQAAEKAGETPEKKIENAPVHNQMQAKLDANLQELSTIKGTDKKVARKLELMGEYLPYIKGILKADTAAQDDVFMNLFVWAIDISEFALAMQMAAHAIKHDLKMPERYSRDVPAVIAEDIADSVNKGDAEISVDQINEVLDLVKEKDLHDAVRSKINKAAGKINLSAGNKEAALKHYVEADRLDARKAGAKTIIKQLTKELNDAQDQKQNS